MVRKPVADGEEGGLDARLARVEANQHALGELAKAMADRLDVQQEKLDALLAAVSREASAGPVEGLLRDLLAETRDQTALLLAASGATETPRA